MATTLIVIRSGGRTVMLAPEGAGTFVKFTNSQTVYLQCADMFF